KVREALRPYYDDMAAQDRNAATRALNGLNPDYRPARRNRLASSFAREGMAAAVREDPELMRQALRAFHMLDPPGRWAKRPAVLAKAARTWIRRKLARAEPIVAAAGPRRGEMFTRLGLSVRADYDRRTWGDT
ncbi:MAG TPA: FAD-dependent oxidoreductase, partial [Caulobacteraceae bacterium]